ncbi:elongation factor G C-terminus-domain-containing protein, partial [Piptocephalis cylindrospora]
MSSLDEKEESPVKAEETEEIEDDENDPSQGAYQMLQELGDDSSEEEEEASPELPEMEKSPEPSKEQDIFDSALEDQENAFNFSPDPVGTKEEKKTILPLNGPDDEKRDKLDSSMLGQIEKTVASPKIEGREGSKEYPILPLPLLPPPGSSDNPVSASQDESTNAFPEDDHHQGHGDDDFDDFASHGPGKEDDDDFDDFTGFDDGGDDGGAFGMEDGAEDPFGNVVLPSTKMSREPSREDTPQLIEVDLPAPLDFTQPWDMLEEQWKDISSKYLFPSISTMTPSVSTDPSKEASEKDGTSPSDSSDPTHTLLEAAMTPREERILSPHLSKFPPIAMATTTNISPSPIAASSKIADPPKRCIDPLERPMPPPLDVENAWVTAALPQEELQKMTIPALEDLKDRVEGMILSAITETRQALDMREQWLMDAEMHHKVIECLVDHAHKRREKEGKDRQSMTKAIGGDAKDESGNPGCDFPPFQEWGTLGDGRGKRRIRSPGRRGERETGKDVGRKRGRRGGNDDCPCSPPFLGLHIQVTRVKGYGEEMTAPALRAAAAQAIAEATESAGITLLEPLMKLDLRVPTSRMGPVISDLTGRRGGTVEEVSEEGPHGGSRVHASVPLGGMVGYSGILRGLTAGEAGYSMEMQGWGKMSKAGVDQVAKQGEEEITMYSS